MEMKCLDNSRLEACTSSLLPERKSMDNWTQPVSGDHKCCRAAKDFDDLNQKQSIRKPCQMIIMAMMLFLVSYEDCSRVASIIRPGDSPGSAPSESMLLLSMFILGIGLGPTLALPGVAKAGTSNVFQMSFAVSKMTSIMDAISFIHTGRSLNCFISGLMSSSVTVTGVTLARDMTNDRHVAWYTLLMVLMPLFGSILGLLYPVSPLTRSHWTLLRYLDLTMIILSLSFDGIGGTDQATSCSDCALQSSQAVSIATHMAALLQPMYIFFNEPIVSLSALHDGARSGVLFFLFFGTLNASDGAANNNNHSFFFGMWAGMCVAAATSVITTYFAGQQGYAVVPDEAGDDHAERYLLVGKIGSFGTPIAFLCFTICDSLGNRDDMSMLAAALLTWSAVCGHISTTLYLFEVYGTPLGYSAMATVFFARYGLTMGLSSFTLLLSPSAGESSTNWMPGLYRYGLLAMIPIPFILDMFGSRMRDMSICAQQRLLLSKRRDHRRSGPDDEA